MGRDDRFIGEDGASFTFQSTRPHGARPDTLALAPCGRPVPIHAPAWGATNPRAPLAHSGPRFNPRARMGRDQWAQVFIYIYLMFQSTRPHGARQIAESVYGRRDEFQSTRPHGARPACTGFTDNLYVVSIHAPAWGATVLEHGLRGHRGVLIHAPAWGATCFKCARYSVSDVSIHAPAWGATAELVSSGGPFLVSIHAPAWGATTG